MTPVFVSFFALPLFLCIFFLSALANPEPTLRRSLPLNVDLLLPRQDSCAAYVPGSFKCDNSLCSPETQSSIPTFCCCCPVGFAVCREPLSCCGTRRDSNTSLPSPSLVTATQVTSGVLPTTTTTAVSAATAPLPAPTPLVISSTTAQTQPTIQTTVPSAPSNYQNVNVTSNDASISYDPPNAWVDSSNSTVVPGCVMSGHVRISATENSTFSFKFVGDTVYIRTVFSPIGGKLSLSINGAQPSIYDTYSPSTSCGVITARRTTSSIQARSKGHAENTCTGKNVDGTTSLDGITYQKMSASSALAVNSWFYHGVVGLVTFLMLAGDIL